MEIQKNLYKEFIESPPANKDEAFHKWKTLSRAIRLLQIVNDIPDGEVNQALRLSKTQQQK